MSTGGVWATEAAMTEDAGWSLGDEIVTVDGVEFRLGYHGGSTSTRFSLIKPMALLERYRALDPPIAGSRVFELGIAEGGSTAWMALEHQPELLVSVDIAERPVTALDDLIRERELAEVVRLHWGVDQSDGDRLHDIVRSELGDAPLDLVFDDASHRYQPTRASFEALFPWLAPGGLYVIEDWSWELREAALIRSYLTDTAAPDLLDRQELLVQGLSDPAVWKARAATMSRLAIELQILCAIANDIVAEVSLNEHWITVRRGAATLDPTTFSLDELVHDDLGLFTPPPRFPT